MCAFICYDPKKNKYAFYDAVDYIMDKAKVNEKVALNGEAFNNLIDSKNISYVKADWTNRNDEIFNLLESYGRSGIPLYVFYPSKNKKPIMIPINIVDRIA